MALLSRKPRAEDTLAETVQPSPPSLPDLPPLETLEHVHAALADLDMRRVEMQAVLDGESAAETALIDADALDQEFAKLTMRVRMARRLLAKLDRREREILTAAQRIEDARRQVQWTSFRAQYTDAARRLSAAAGVAFRCRAEVDAISQAAHMAGFGDRGVPALPVAYGVVPWHFLTLPHEWAAGLPEMAPQGAHMSLGATTYVEFKRALGSNLPGTVALVPVERARWLVEQGIAAEMPYSPFGAGPAPDAGEPVA